MSDYREDTGMVYKLNDAQLRALVPPDVADRIIALAEKRKPGKFARKVERYALNGPGTIWVQNVNYYGGEHFGEPYCFTAEIRYFTTRSAFARCVNRLRATGRLGALPIPFTY